MISAASYPHGPRSTDHLTEHDDAASFVVPLDTNTARFDVAEAIRAARRSPVREAEWRGVPVQLHEDESALTIGAVLVLHLHRVPARVPYGSIVPGPVFAECPRRCGRRARVLWDRSFGGTEPFLVCRACALVSYASASTRSEIVRATIAYERARERLGLREPWQTFERAPYQRRAVHARLAARLDDARRRLEAATRSVA